MVKSSRKDNMPHCLIEAFAAGLPVVTIPSGGIPYIVQDGVNGLHVPMDDPTAMARAVRRLLQGPDLAEMLARNGWTEVNVRYSWEAAKRGCVALYSRLSHKK